MISLKRIYDQPSQADGLRILIDRLWPRGVSQERAAIDVWLKDIAPSPNLRLWFNHQPDRFKEFSLRYTEELSNNPKIEELIQLVDQHPQITLLYAAKDPDINHAVVLQKFMENRQSVA